MLMDHEAPSHAVLELAVTVHERLRDRYGERDREPSDPVRSLVVTILSQNTNDVNRDRAYRRLEKRFSDWNDVRDAPTEDVLEAIRPAGLAPTKAPRIQEALKQCTRPDGSVSLEFLRDLPLEEARAWLLDIPGVGPKTAAIVLLFALGRPAFPVDTHIHRVTRRLGILPQNTGREKAHEMLEEILPDRIYYTFHINLIAHGRDTCHARGPECGRCLLRDLCAYYATATDEQPDEDSRVSARE